jgi:hypothetical protein
MISQYPVEHISGFKRCPTRNVMGVGGIWLALASNIRAVIVEIEARGESAEEPRCVPQIIAFS